MKGSDLRRRASELGVELRYEDVDKVTHEADDDVLEVVVAELEADNAAGQHRATEPILVLEPQATQVRLPGTASVHDAALTIIGRSVNVEVASDPDGTRITFSEALPIGCHSLSLDLGPTNEEVLVVVPPPSMPGLPGDRRWSSLFVPAYALWQRDVPLPSFRNLGEVAKRLGAAGIDMLATLPLYSTFLDDPYDPSPYSPISRLHWNEAYLDDERLPAAPALPAGEVVDWRALGARRHEQLLSAARSADDAELFRLERFLDELPDVADYARFRAGRMSGAGVGDPMVERAYGLAQLWCDDQLREATRSGNDSAQLSLDLPIGSHPEGYEVWSNPDLFATSMSVGAPPDSFFTGGQNWGFPPPRPGEMRRSGYRLWRDMIARAGRHADMLRIDHVMAVHRLWWIPEGVEANRGVYVRYPQRELLAMIAASAATAGMAVVGEDLGTVPPEVSAALDEVSMLGMYEEQFMTGSPKLATIPERVVAGIRTHDMQAFAEFAATTDLERYRVLLEKQLGALPSDLIEAVLSRLSRSDARMIVADLDDLLDEHKPHNLPGQIVDGIWQRRLGRTIAEIFDDPTVRRRLEILDRRR